MFSFVSDSYSIREDDLLKPEPALKLKLSTQFPPDIYKIRQKDKVGGSVEAKLA